MSSSAERGGKVLRGEGRGDDERWDEPADRDDEREPDEPADAAELDPQLERAEGEGMVTEHAKVSATDPGPEPDPEEPAPDHGPGAPD